MQKFSLLVGAVIAAIAASACCILPLILGMASAGSIGLGAALPLIAQRVRFTFLLLGA